MSKDYEVPREAILAAADAMGLLPDEIDNVLIDALEAAAPHMNICTHDDTQGEK